MTRARTWAACCVILSITSSCEHSVVDRPEAQPEAEQDAAAIGTLEAKDIQAILELSLVELGLNRHIVEGSLNLFVEGYAGELPAEVAGSRVIPADNLAKEGSIGLWIPTYRDESTGLDVGVTESHGVYGSTSYRVRLTRCDTGWAAQVLPGSSHGL